jgi:integrase
MRGMGRIFQRGEMWWIAYYFNGEERRESSRSLKEGGAKRLLKERLKQIHGGRYVGAEEEKRTIAELLDALETHLENRGAKALAQLKSHLKPVRRFFALERAMSLTTADIERYIAERRAIQKAPATINREIGGLKQAFHLARKQGRLSRVPYFPMMREDNARQGFFENDTFEKVVAQLPAPINDLAWFAYLSGWRRGEIVPLRWDAVDRSAREVRLRTSKNGEGRVLPLEGELWSVIERRWAARTIEQEDGTAKISEFVFHRGGDQIVDFRKIWNEAFKKAKTGRKLFHDLRRTAVRNMVRAGVPQAVAMTISGHKTASMFQRYNVTSGPDQVDALKRTAAHLASLSKPDQGTVIEMPEATRAR